MILSLFAVSAVTQSTVTRLRITIASEEEPKGVSGFFSNVWNHLTLKSYRPDPGTKFKVVATAYASNVAQTDSSPCITASGTVVRKGVIATNFLPIGTKLRIGSEVFVVEDRMNSKYNGQKIIDIWYPSTSEAIDFGKQNLEIEILSDNYEVGKKVEESETSASQEDEEGISFFVRVGILFSEIGRNLATRTMVYPDTDCANVTP